MTNTKHVTVPKSLTEGDIDDMDSVILESPIIKLEPVDFIKKRPGVKRIIDGKVVYISAEELEKEMAEATEYFNE